MDSTASSSPRQSHPSVHAVFEVVEGPVVTSSDVAAELDCTTEAARRTLEQLRKEGLSRAARLPVGWSTGEKATSNPDTARSGPT